eukprot:1152494-Pelagomonas_calceolata.AAC.1
MSIVLIGGIICNDYTIKPFINLGSTRQIAKSLASKLNCHATQRGLLGKRLLGARQRRAEGESGRPGAWPAARQIPISSDLGISWRPCKNGERKSASPFRVKRPFSTLSTKARVGLSINGSYPQTLIIPVN